MPERRFTILLTGPVPVGGTALTDLPANVSVDIVPFISTIPVAESRFRERLHALSRQPINAIFTSGEAVRIARESGPVPASRTSWSTSGSTESLIREWLGDAATVNTAPDASGLADLIISSQVTQAVFFCGDQRRDVLPDKLKSAGIQLEELILYQTLATPVKLRQEYDAVLFFSPSAVTSFLTLNNPGKETAVFALGNTTAEALRQRITGTVIVAEKSDKNLLLQKAVEYAFANRIL